MQRLPDWSTAFGGPITQGLIRYSTSDFYVSESLGYELTGDGEHDYLWIEKENTNTAWVASRLAKHANIRDVDVGFAGLKDRRAVTRQWFSVRRPNASGTDWRALQLSGVRIVEQTRHVRKLKRGAHAGNRFRIAVRETTEPQSVIAEKLEMLQAHGVPNYFGEQRFGRGGNNLQLAEAVFAGRRLSRSKRSIGLSAARSFLFNQILDTRVRDGSWNRILPGESACLDGSNSIFSVEEIDRTLETRCEAMDIHPGGALWGRGEPSSSAEVLSREKAATMAHQEYRSGLESEMAQSRRSLRLVVRDLQWEFLGDVVRLEFRLDRGGFATAVLRELVSQS